MGYITEQCKQRVIDAADVHGVISDFIQLHKKGAGFWACCPFHGEKSPSFYVNPARNRFHCFGCGEGGDAVAFLMKHQNMTFQQAIEWLAKKYNIEVRYESKEQSQQERDDAKHRESLFFAVAEVQKFFIECFNSDAPDAMAARKYAYNRWGEDFCKEYGIGYAPKGSAAFFDFIKRKQLSEDYLIELGYIGVNEADKSRYAMFRDRVTIPIYNRWFKVCAFTGRYNGANPDIGKYMNSRTSPIFKKEECVFGLPDAIKMARITKQFILVEGGPDVLRLQSIGITQAVGALGTAWGEKHFKQLHSVCNSVCFIPDSEKPKGNSQFGAGFNAVFRAGEIALSLGLSVTVREIPLDDGKDKEDADSFITSRDVFASLEEQSFILWYARKLFSRPDRSLSSDKEAVHTIARLVALVDDKFDRDNILSALPDIYGKAKSWKEAVKQADISRKKEAEEAASSNLGYEESAMRRFGIIVQHGKYYIAGKDDQLVRISNFVLKPVFHIKSNDNAIRIYRIINELGDEDAIELSQEEMVSLPRFKKRIENLGNFMFIGKAESLDQMKEYLYSITKTCEQVSLMGWNADNRFFAFGNGLFYENNWFEVNELGLVSCGGKTFYLPACSDMHRNDKGMFGFELDFIHKPDSTITLREYVAKLIQVFGDNAMVGFAFLVASLFRDVIYPVKDSFPILNLFGPPNSGKTALGTSLMAFFHPVSEPSKVYNTTVPSLNQMLSRVANAIEILDEYKNDVPMRMIELIKGVWGGKGQTKTDPATKKIIDTFFTCSLIICGQEMPTIDPALFTRVVHLSYSRTDFSAEEKKRYVELKELAHHRLTHLTVELLRLRPTFENRYRDMYQTCSEEIMVRLNGEAIKDRIFDNWVILLAAFRTVETLIDVPFTYRDLFEFCFRQMRSQNDMVKKKSELADFWKMFASLYMNGRLIEGAHFRIITDDKFIPSGKGQKLSFDGRKAILCVNFNSVEHVIASRSGMAANASKIDLPTLEPFLEISPQFLGRKQVRMVKLNNTGSPDTTVENMQRVTMSTRVTCICFDYASLKGEFDINLETMKLTEAEERAEDYADSEQEAANDVKAEKPPTLFDDNKEEELPF